MAIFVINEWLLEDSSGNNGLEFQRQAFSIITALAASEHQIVIIEGSPFDQKAWSLCKGTGSIIRAITRLFVVSLRQNSDRCRILKPEPPVAIPEQLAGATKHDDHYLLHAQLAVEGAILVTTDGPLREAVRNAGLPCLFREEFLNTYF